MNLAKKVARKKEHENHRGNLFGVVVFFDIWRNEATGERRLIEIGRTEVMDSWEALNVYANTPNPASQLLRFRHMDEYKEVSDELVQDCKDPKWLQALFEQI